MEDRSSMVKVRRWSCNRGGINYEKGLDLNFCSLMEVWRFRESWGCRRCVWICEDSFVGDSCLVWVWWSWAFWWDWDLYFVWNIRELVLLIEKILRTGKRTLFDEHYLKVKCKNKTLLFTFGIRSIEKILWVRWKNISFGEEGFIICIYWKK